MGYNRVGFNRQGEGFCMHVLSSINSNISYLRSNKPLAGIEVTYPIQNMTKTTLFLLLFFNEIYSNEGVKKLQITLDI